MALRAFRTVAAEPSAFEVAKVRWETVRRERQELKARLAGARSVRQLMDDLESLRGLALSPPHDEYELLVEVANGEVKLDRSMQLEEVPAFSLREGAALRAALVDAGEAYVSISGSGSAFFGVFGDAPTATGAAEALRFAGHVVWHGMALAA